MKAEERKVADPDFGKRSVHREPDALIDEKLFGHKVDWRMCGNRQEPYRTGWHDFGMPFSVPYYHTEIQDAMQIVEAFRRRRITLSIKSEEDLDPKANNCQDLIDQQDMKYCVQWWDREDQRYRPGVLGRTAQEAICKQAFIILEKTQGEQKWPIPNPST